MLSIEILQYESIIIHLKILILKKTQEERKPAVRELSNERSKKDPTQSGAIPSEN